MGLSAIFCKTSALQVDEVLDKGGSSQLLLPETSLDPFTHVVPGHSWHRGLLGGSTFWLFWDGMDEVLIFIQRGGFELHPLEMNKYYYKIHGN